MDVNELQKARSELRRDIVNHVNEQLRQFTERTGVDVRGLEFNVLENSFLGGSRTCILADLDIHLDI